MAALRVRAIAELGILILAILAGITVVIPLIMVKVC